MLYLYYIHIRINFQQTLMPGNIVGIGDKIIFKRYIVTTLKKPLMFSTRELNQVY